ncbi:histidinol-phosphatase [Paenibacillus lutimineralis]|uniref:Histidinol-phosphatase n=1 Tax=Paenibacillus lutimineralis TaxID=2707005 RepID=A0A3Q9I9D2_9BACL|nr:histidinol-phosphatase [Paenibacillus lutimineralis]AZS14016.1 histidinol-phosphatase HisJ family protein [Paenibacillus lutimineralis]
MFDLHTHHERCGHAAGTIEQYIESAISKGIQVLGITDHSPYFFADEDHPFPGLAMAKSEFARYVEEAVQLKEKYGDRIELLIGVESDIFKEHMVLYNQVYRGFPLDYVIGSIHFTSPSLILQGLDWSQASEEERMAEFRRFIELMQHAVQSDWVNIIGHMDRVHRGNPSFEDLYAPYIAPLLKTMAGRGAVLEVNTGGFRKSAKDWYPSINIIEQAYHYGVDVTFGSDAHDPLRVGDEWEEVRQTLEQIGYKRWVIFRQRRPYYLDIHS